MEEKWYIRGKKGYEGLIKQELTERGAIVNIDSFNYSAESCLFIVVDGIVICAYDGTDAGRYIIKRWKEVKVEKPKPKFKPFDKVLGCNGRKTGIWHIDLYSHYNAWSSSPHVCMNSSYNHCLPYEGNEHLVGTKFEPENVS